MTSQPLNRPCGVDVRAAMDAAEFSLRCDGCSNEAEIADDLKLAQAAVSELMEALKDERRRESSGTSDDYFDARVRTDAALAAVEGKA